MSMKKKTISPRSREEAKQETREALIRAAALLFKSSGLDVSLDAVCAEAGYTRGAFYVHFKDRDDLISTVLGRIGDQVLDALLGTGESPNSAGNNDLLTLAQRFQQAMISGDYPLTRKGGLPPYQLLDACARSAKIRDQYVRLTESGIERLALALREGQDKGQIRKDMAPEPVASLLVSIVIGLHTMYDLDMNLDMTAGAMAIMQMLTPPGA